MYTYSFATLEVWVEAKELSKNIYHISKPFSKDEKFSLTSQLKRASISICSDTAEGSAVEGLNQIIIAHDLKFISDLSYKTPRLQMESITNKLKALRNYQINK
jgi:hypothetical protein